MEIRNVVAVLKRADGVTKPKKRGRRGREQSEESHEEIKRRKAVWVLCDKERVRDGMRKETSY